jgi:hypothetical protein
LSPYFKSYFSVSSAEVSNLFLWSLVIYPFVLPIGTHFTANGVDPKIMIFVGGSIGLTLMFLASCCQPD